MLVDLKCFVFAGIRRAAGKGGLYHSVKVNKRRRGRIPVLRPLDVNVKKPEIRIIQPLREPRLHEGVPKLLCLVSVAFGMRRAGKGNV